MKPVWPMKKKPVWPLEKFSHPEKETCVTPWERNLCDSLRKKPMWPPSYYVMEKLKVGLWDSENFWLVAGKKHVWPPVTMLWKSWRLEFGLWNIFWKTSCCTSNMGATQCVTQYQWHSHCSFVLPPQVWVNDELSTAQNSVVPTIQIWGPGKMEWFD